MPFTQPSAPFLTPSYGYQRAGPEPELIFVALDKIFSEVEVLRDVLTASLPASAGQLFDATIEFKHRQFGDDLING